MEYMEVVRSGILDDIKRNGYLYHIGIKWLRSEI
jgi:hypothetical protein